MKNLTFITGAVRSGKSLLAEEIAAAGLRTVYYLATMQILGEDEEQTRRLDLHRRRRPAHWHTLEAPFDAHELVRDLPAGESCVIFDCLSLYITNVLIATTGGDGTKTDPYLCQDEIMNAINALLESMALRAEIEFVIVSNEVGWGVVPETKLGRAFRDFLGLANQMVAGKSAKAYLSCAGLRVQLK